MIIVAVLACIIGVSVGVGLEMLWFYHAIATKLDRVGRN